MWSGGVSGPGCVAVLARWPCPAPHLCLALVHLQGLLANEVSDLLLVDLNVGAADEEGAVARAGDGSHDLIHSQGQDARVALAAQHGVRLASCCLAIGKHCAIVAIHHRVHVALDSCLKQLSRGGGLAKHQVWEGARGEWAQMGEGGGVRQGSQVAGTQRARARARASGAVVALTHPCHTWSLAHPWRPAAAAVPRHPRREPQPSRNQSSCWVECAPAP